MPWRLRKEGKKEIRIQTEDQKIVHMALGYMPLKQNSSFENASFKTVFENNFSNLLSDLVTFSSDTM